MIGFSLSVQLESFQNIQMIRVLIREIVLQMEECLRYIYFAPILLLEIMFILASLFLFFFYNNYKQTIKNKTNQTHPSAMHYLNMLFYFYFCLWLPKSQYNSYLWNTGALFARHFHFCIFSAPYFISMNSVGLPYSVSHTCI